MNALGSGLHLGPYQLLDLIGRTGMSEVWRALSGDGKIVALKTISSQAGEDPHLRARFWREGCEHQLLVHPAIVPILDFFELDGNFFLVMQYISGGSLEDRLENLGWKPLPVNEALQIAQQILSALDYAHRRSVIHRDVKPSNILLDADRAFLSDFGIALALRRPRLTGYSQIMGTRRYMSPEQLQTPLEVTHLTDVYSFGCVLYEMLTGHQPHEEQEGSHEGSYAKLAKRAYDPPIPLRQWNPEISMRLERIVLTSLSPSPNDRFPGCGSFAKALEAVTLENTVKPIAVPPPPPVRLPAATPIPGPSQSKDRLQPGSAKPKRRLSVLWNVLACFVVGLLWVPSLDSGKDALSTAFLLSMGIANLLLFRVLYKAWEAFPPGNLKTSPGKVVGFLLIPFFNIYWCWKAFPGFADNFNRHVQDSGAQARPQPRKLYEWFCIFNFYAPWLGVIPGLTTLTGCAFIFDLVIFVPLMAGVLANAANRLIAISALPQATAAKVAS